MIDISLAGLLGAIAGTAVAAVLYHLLIGTIERRIRARAQNSGEGAGIAQAMPLIRRSVLISDLLICAGFGYWLGQWIGD